MAGRGVAGGDGAVRRLKVSGKLVDECCKGAWRHQPQCVFCAVASALFLVGAVATCAWGLTSPGMSDLGALFSPGPARDTTDASMTAMAFVAALTFAIMAVVFAVIVRRIETMPYELGCVQTLTIRGGYLVHTLYDDERSDPGNATLTVARLADCAWSYDERGRTVTIVATRAGAIRSCRLDAGGGMGADGLWAQALGDGDVERLMAEGSPAGTDNVVERRLELYPVFTPDLRATLGKLGVRRADASAEG